MRDEQFSGCLNELRRERLLPQSCQAVIVVGSAVRGWANKGSDYDIYLVSRDPWFGQSGTELRLPLDPPTVPTAVTHTGGRRWELKYWLDAQVDQMLEKVSWAQYARGLVAGQLLNDVEEVFLERLVTAVPLMGQEWLARRSRELSDSAFRAFVVTRSLAWSDDSIEDAIGQLSDGDEHSAVLSARKAFGHTIDALLESVGEYGYYTPKWRARRVREAKQDVITFADYWNIETMYRLDPSAPRSWVEKVIEVCRGITMYIEVPGPEGPN